MEKHILFIEDESVLQKTVSAVFERDNIRVTAALDGAIGLRLAHQLQPDLILLDLVLPKVDGFEVLAALRADPQLSVIPVLVLTNLQGSADVERALALGAAAYLVKADYALSEVVEKVKGFLKP